MFTIKEQSWTIKSTKDVTIKQNEKGDIPTAIVRLEDNVPIQKRKGYRKRETAVEIIIADSWGVCSVTGKRSDYDVDINKADKEIIIRKRPKTNMRF
ncbi:hypothetical protein CVD28_11595 [Bacillus sp. M6-12]|uniref:hypothetical protein n=1 Tax=Bacillus sp. M6-12 TaxID=2054166 RepID=UPI000C77E6F1|nr:hypothetical protein [Bacillus sp. M6-12]PLS17628.1 hypothetical protein CVD28_11595 [Bacillus sp. M6-12]